MRKVRDHVAGVSEAARPGPDPWRTPAWGGDRRLVRRLACRTAAEFRESQRRRVPVAIANLSTHGCAVKSAERQTVGTRCWVVLPTLQGWEATVAWSDGAQCGLAFSRPLHRAVAEMVVRRANGSLPWSATS